MLLTQLQLSPYSYEYLEPWVLKSTKPEVGHWKLDASFENLNLLDFSKPRALISQHHLKIAAIAISPTSVKNVKQNWVESDLIQMLWFCTFLATVSYETSQSLLNYHQQLSKADDTYWRLMGHWKKKCFLHSSPKGKDGLCTGSFHEKMCQPLLAYVLDIWSNSGSEFPLLSFCRGFAQPFLLCITSPASKAQETMQSWTRNVQEPVITAILSNYPVLIVPTCYTCS